jgi:hypothetical protein
MFDDLERLKASESLLRLLTHYAKLAEPNREAWQPRLMALDGVEAGELSKLHGLLIAMDCIEMKVGEVAAGYRVTAAGLRMLRHAQAPDGEEIVEVVEEAKPKFPRRKREKPQKEAASSAAAA